MNRLLRSAMAVSLCLISSVSYAQEEKPDRKEERKAQFERKLAEAKKAIADLRAAGENEKAAAVEKELKATFAKMQDQVKPTGGYPEALRQKLEEAVKAGRLEEAEKLKHYLNQVLASQRVKQEQPGKGEGEHVKVKEAPAGRHFFGHGHAEEAERRAHHLSQAAENLAAAGLEEQARDLHRQAETLRQHGRGESGPHPELRELHQLIRQQNERIERLEQMVRQLAEAVERGSSKPEKE